MKTKAIDTRRIYKNIIIEIASENIENIISAGRKDKTVPPIEIFCCICRCCDLFIISLVML